MRGAVDHHICRTAHRLCLHGLSRNCPPTMHQSAALEAGSAGAQSDGYIEHENDKRKLTSQLPGDAGGKDTTGSAGERSSLTTSRTSVQRSLIDCLEIDISIDPDFIPRKRKDSMYLERKVVSSSTETRSSSWSASFDRSARAPMCGIDRWKRLCGKSATSACS